jgi:hypothetical protein
VANVVYEAVEADDAHEVDKAVKANEVNEVDGLDKTNEVNKANVNEAGVSVKLLLFLPFSLTKHTTIFV